jgi:hypothetical protein
MRRVFLFSQEKSLEISHDDGKFQLITENFGTLGSKFLLNKQLFSSLKIRRYMMRWMKCWARKSPTYVKNLGNVS